MNNINAIARKAIDQSLGLIFNDSISVNSLEIARIDDRHVVIFTLFANIQLDDDHSVGFIIGDNVKFSADLYYDILDAIECGDTVFLIRYLFIMSTHFVDNG
jgi:hypothetical protein